jgi:hypothetical protein
MAKVAVAVRLDPVVVEWADAYAKERGVSRQAVLEGAVLDFREDAERGVRDVPRLDAVAPRVAEGVGKVSRPVVPPPKQRFQRSEQSRMAMERMRRMDPGRYGGGL